MGHIMKYSISGLATAAFVVTAGAALASPVTTPPQSLTASGNVTLVFIGFEAADTNFLSQVGGMANIFCNYAEGSCSLGSASGAVADLGTQSGQLTFELHDISVANVFDTISLASDGAYHANIVANYADLGIFPMPAPAASAISTVSAAHPGSVVWYIGFEDRLKGDYDYNDFVIAAVLSPENSVPEPMTLSLVGTGLFLMGSRRRRKV